MHGALTGEERERVWELVKVFVGRTPTKIRWGAETRTLGESKESKTLYAIPGAYDCRTQIKAAGGRWDAQRRAWIVTGKQFEELQKLSRSKKDPNFSKVWDRLQRYPLLEKKGRPLT